MVDLTIKDGRVAGALWIPSPNMYAGFHESVTLLVNHYTASGGDNARSDGTFFQSKAAKASAHFIVGRDGDLIQCVSLHDRAWHAGVSSWRGRPNCNDYSYGVEYDNYGWCIQDALGHYHPGANPSGTLSEQSVGKGQHKNTAISYQWWEIYSTAQIEMGIALSNALLEATPSITEIVGHEDIAPQRKIDPGPLFPWTHFNAGVLGRASGQYKASVIASVLNVRSGPGTDHPVVGKLNKGEEVTITYGGSRQWAQITAQDGKLTGYVAEQYLLRTE